MKTSFQLFTLLFLLIFTTGLIVSCTNTDKTDEEEVISDDLAVVEIDYWLIDEHAMNDIALTSMAEESEPDAEGAVDTAEADMEEDMAEEEAAEEQEAEEEIATEMYDEEVAEYEYDIAMIEELHEDLLEAEYIAETTIEVTQVVIPLDETQTVVAYNKKGDPESAIQVISTPDGEVEQIIFQDKKHKDVYDVQAGMSNKEVKKLRKELKHMVHKGQVFLYSEESNIMYLTDIQNMAGDEITEVDIENSEVSAIVWKDKKHHKKNKEQ